MAVYDFGGGTFDCSLLKRLAGGRYQELDSEGVRRCGGGDIDDALYEHVLTELVSRRKVAKLKWVPKTGQAQLRRQCEKSKIDLSNDLEQELAPLTLSNVIGTRSRHAAIRKEMVGIERETLVNFAKPLVKKTMVALGKLLKRNKAELGELCGVILSGGSSALPGVEGVQRALGRIDRKDASVISK